MRTCVQLLVMGVLLSCAHSAKTAGDEPAEAAEHPPAAEAPKPPPEPAVVLPPAPVVPAGPAMLGAAPETAENPTTPEKVQLGYLLFFDKRLSKDDSTPCEGCHHIAQA